MKLNKQQQSAVEHKQGPLLIIAGAGTGKTTVITERIKHLILKGSAKPSEILALTFTEKAAREMEERVDVAMPYGYSQLWIGTYHSFCDRILKNEGIHIGLNPGYRLMTQAESVQFFRKKLFSFKLHYFRPLGNPTKFILGMLQHFSRLKDEDVSPVQYSDWVKSKFQNSNVRTKSDLVKPNPKSKIQNKLKAQSSKEEEEKVTEIDKWMELARAYECYEQLKAREGKMDFSDLISYALRLFRTRPHILKQYKEQFSYVLIDEFQDTNIAQYELIKLLVPPKDKPNLTVVGDDSQSIYKFRGAAVSNILSFMKDYPTAKQIILTDNYRSTQTILDQSHRLIKHNDPDTLEAKLGINKNLVSSRKLKGEQIGLIYENRVEDEAQQVADEITRLVSDETANYSFKDFAILVRANNHAESFVRSFKRAGIPYQFLGPGMLFRQKEVKDLIAYLKVLHNFEDSVAMYRVLTMEFWDMSARDLAAITIFSKKYNLSLFETGEAIAEVSQKGKTNYQLPFISQKTKDTMTVIIAMIHRHLKLVPTETAGQILFYFLQDSGMLKTLVDYKTAGDEHKAKNISKFFDKLKTYEAEHEDASVAAVVDWIELALEMGESPAATDMDWFDEDAVNILTVHSSKGLEFPIVFLVNLCSGRFPTIERREQIPIPDELIKETLPEGDYHLEEERRLFYVGMTRAKDRLYFTSANYYGEGKREKKLSTFVGETLGAEVIKKISNQVIEERKIEQLSFLEWEKKDKEKKPPITQLLTNSIAYLSYSQIETFNLCPLKYKYRYLLKIPSPASAAASFGQTLHEVLRAFYQLVKSGENGTKELLLSLIDQKWISLGYNSKQHEKRMRKEADTMLKGFYQTAFNADSKPLGLEQNFMVRLKPNLKIGGKIDRVDKVGNKIEIIDYKTGKVPSQRDIDRSLQMTVYAIAATDGGLYETNVDDVILSFYFFQGQKRISTSRTNEQLEKAKEELIKKAEEMGMSDFQPKVGKHCDFCEFRLICPAWEE